MTNQEILEFMGENIRVYEMLQFMTDLQTEYGHSELMEMFNTKWFEGCEYAVPIFLMACKDDVSVSTLDRLTFALYRKLIDDIGAEKSVSYVQKMLCDEYRKWQYQQDQVINTSIFTKKQRT